MLRGKSKEYYDKIKAIADGHNKKDDKLKVVVGETDMETVLKINPALQSQWNDIRRMPDFIICSVNDGVPTVFLFITNGMHEELKDIDSHVKETVSKVTKAAYILLKNNCR